MASASKRDHAPAEHHAPAGKSAKMQHEEDKKAFMEVYKTLSDEIIADEVADNQTTNAVAWMREMMDYNVPLGKLNRGLAVLDGVRALQPKGASKEVQFLAMTVGWCIEWLQAFFLVADDMMDHSITRRGQPCWYKVPKVGLNACNDCIVLEACIYKILKKHVKKLPCYLPILELFHDVTYQTSCGQLIDLITAPIGQVDLSKYTIETYMRIVTYKTAFYTFYLPAASAMHLCGIEDERAFDLARDICVRLGQFFQIQDDYLDCYGDPAVIGKVGTDIEDNKCSWLVVQALARCSDAQRKVFELNYGQNDPAKVAAIKAVYAELKLEAVYHEYESKSYEELTALINSQDLLPKALFGDMLAKIYKRQK